MVRREGSGRSGFWFEVAVAAPLTGYCAAGGPAAASPRRAGASDHRPARGPTCGFGGRDCLQGRLLHESEKGALVRQRWPGLTPPQHGTHGLEAQHWNAGAAEGPAVNFAGATTKGDTETADDRFLAGSALRCRASRCWQTGCLPHCIAAGCAAFAYRRLLGTTGSMPRTLARTHTPCRGCKSSAFCRRAGVLAARRRFFSSCEITPVFDERTSLAPRIFKWA